MNYLIDGHNLIGRLDDIQLSDPDDEAKLVLRLVNWAATGKNRRVIVVFDGGVPGANWVHFKSDRVKVVFVPQGQTADDWLVRFMREQVGKNVKDYQLVTGDRAVLKQAENRRIPFVTSAQFAEELARERAYWSQLGQENAPPPQRPLLQPHEVDAWLQFFGGEPEVAVRPHRPPDPTPPQPSPPSAVPPGAPSADPDDMLLSPREVAEWLALFGGEPTIITVHEAGGRAKSRSGSQTGKAQAIRPQRKGPPAPADSPLTQDDVDLWHTLFGKDKG